MEFWQLIADVWENDIARVFSLAIAVVFVLSLLTYRIASMAAFSRHGSTLCTTLGVLGTFTGIFLGLLEFDVAKIDASVPELLVGLKIAFSTSIVGLGAAVLLRIIQPLLPAPPDSGSETTPDAIHQTLRNIEDTISRSADEHAAALTNLRHAISADGDSSLVTQVQGLRISVEDGNRELITQFKQFADTMAENNSRALIEALEKVIRDFNTQLNEQFGENFKQLNQAVQALLEWQERYRSHIETLEARIEAAVKALESSEAALRDVADHAARIPEAFAKMQELLDRLTTVTESLPQLLEELGKDTEELNAHLKAVADLRDRAVEAFPTIEKNIDLLTENLATTIDSHTEVINNSATEMQRQHQEQVRQVQEMINGHFQQFDQQMQNELTQAIEAMGRHLASLSEKLAEDYGPLTERLRELLDATRGGRQ